MRVAVRGQFRRLPGAGEGHVQPSRLSPTSVRLAGVNSINWARIVAQAVYYFTAAVALGAPHRKVGFTVPTGNFGDIFAGHVARSMGLPIDRLVIATNVNDILVAHADDRRLRAARGGRHLLALDGHPGLVEFRAAAVRSLSAATAAAIRGLMDGFAQSKRFEIADGRPRRHPRRLCRRPRRRGGGRRHHAHRIARDRPFRRSAHRGRHRGRREGAARPGTADGRAVDRACGEIPGRGGGRLRRASAIAGLAVRT